MRWNTTGLNSIKLTKIISMIQVVIIMIILQNKILAQNIDEEEKQAEEFLKDLNAKYLVEWSKTQYAAWNYETNMSPENLNEMGKINDAYAAFEKSVYPEILKFKNWQQYKNSDTKRQFADYTVLGFSGLLDGEKTEYDNIVANMTQVYSTLTVCDNKDKQKCDLPLDPDLLDIMTRSRDPNELKHYWLEWRNKIGSKEIRAMYQRYVTILQDVAEINNFENPVDFWMFTEHYGRENFTRDIENLWEKLLPHYKEIHAYTRHKLQQKYPDLNIASNGLIPAHLLGNMWAQEWEGISDIINPFTDAPVLDVTTILKQKYFKPLQMAQAAEKFFISMGLQSMVPDFWKSSIFSKPPNRDIVCSSSAWDMGDNKNFRIKMCADLTAEDLYALHHEMTHVENYMELVQQPFTYRDAPNVAILEATADSVAMNVNTPNYLQKLGLLSNDTISNESDMNYLFITLVSWYPLLAFALVLDYWRWGVFREQISPKSYNCHWWKIAAEVQGIMPPEERSENNFDPVSKYHIVSGAMYIRYFVGTIWQYQFLEAMCIASEQFNPNDPNSRPLHKCDIYGSTKAGDKLKALMRMGKSKPWPEAVKAMTGSDKIEVEPFFRYFEPILTWIKDYNEKNGVTVGWSIPADGVGICRPFPV